MRHHGPVPELPEVEALARFLRERTHERTVTGVEVGAISALKTFRPPPDALVGGLVVILMNAGRIPGVLSMVVREALTMQSAFGFGMFVAMRYGIARGIYANEAGYGTAAVAYGTAQSTQPAQQGLNAVMETFIVSFVTSSISAMTILLTGAWQSGLTSTAAVAAGFNSVMPVVGGWIVGSLLLLTFVAAASTLTAPAAPQDPAAPESNRPAVEAAA